MVFEELYKISYLKQRPYIAFLLGIAYCIAGLAFATVVFKQDPALVAVAVTSIFLLPTLHELSVSEEHILKKAKRHTPFSLLKENKDFVLIYLWIFVGIMLVFSFFSIALPALAGNHLFKQQLAVHYGRAVFTMPLFFEITANNLKVLLLCFVISLIAGNGSIFLITWNASVWGTIFGNLAKAAASAIAGNPFIVFGLVLASVLPHTLLEALGYICAVLAGTAISRGFVAEKFGSIGMHRVLTQGLLLLFLAGIIIIIAGIVETVVLDIVSLYQKIILLSFR